jgi:proteic killer suppression protein
MKIGKVSHRGLRRFMENDDVSGLPPEYIEKVRNIVSFLLEIGDMKELQNIPSWRAHQLSGARKGVWSLTVTRNWRITFRISHDGKEIIDLDFEDYH